MTAQPIRVDSIWRSKDPRDDGMTAHVLAVDASFVYVQRLIKSRIRIENFLRRYTPVGGGS